MVSMCLWPKRGEIVGRRKNFSPYHDLRSISNKSFLKKNETTSFLFKRQPKQISYRKKKTMALSKTFADLRGTANYVARLYGVRAAMPGFIAVEMVKQPQLVGSKMPPDELTLSALAKRFFAKDFCCFFAFEMNLFHYHSNSLSHCMQVLKTVSCELATEPRIFIAPNFAKYTKAEKEDWQKRCGWLRA